MSRARITTPWARLCGFLRADRGAAGAEIAIWAAALVAPVFGTVDLANYTYRKMQVNDAAQAAAQRAWTLCNTSAKLPAVQSCTGLATAMSAAAQATSLAANVTVSATTEGYYCSNSAGALVLVGQSGGIGTPPVKPSPFNCASVTTGSAAAPGDYIVVTTSYTYTPAFGAISFTALLPTSVTRTAWMRLS